MASFDDFMSTLTEDVVAAIVDDANLKAQEIRKNCGSGLSTIGTQIGIVSYTISLELLACYHKWLEQQSLN